jgi:Glycosyl hydrolase family 79 C-terminal beta domain
MARRRFWLPVLAGATALTVAGIVGTLPARAATSTTVTVGSGSGATLHDDFIGLSFEASVLASPALTTGNLAQYMKTLGPGVMRFGGNFVDTTFWTSKGEKAPSWAVTTLTPADLARLAKLASATGWKVILGVNLKHPDPARAADEAAHAKAVLGSALKAIEIGNEPNYYPDYTPARLWGDYQNYRAAINKSAPGVGLVAPETGSAPKAVTFLQDFAKREQGHVDLAALTTHFYPACARSGPVSIADLLSPAFHEKIRARGQILVDAAKPLKIPPIMDEANSVSCEGQDGTSDVYASSLWAVDDELLIASLGIRGEYFHSAIAKCGAPKPLYKAYTPFCAPTDADAAKGNLRAQPEYYGLLMLQQVGTGTFVPVTSGDTDTLRSYAIRNGTRLRLVLDNLQSSGSRTVTVHLGGSFTQGTLLRLTGPSLTARTGISLGGATVAADGTFPGTSKTAISVSGSTLTLSLPAGTATLVTLNP